MPVWVATKGDWTGLVVVHEDGIRVRLDGVNPIGDALTGREIDKTGNVTRVRWRYSKGRGKPGLPPWVTIESSDHHKVEFSVLVNPGTNANICVQTGVTYFPEGLTFLRDTSKFFLVERISIGKKDILARRLLRADSFVAKDSRIHLGRLVCYPSMFVVIAVTNIGNEALVISGAVHGTIASDSDLMREAEGGGC